MNRKIVADRSMPRTELSNILIYSPATEGELSFFKFSLNHMLEEVEKKKCPERFKRKHSAVLGGSNRLQITIDRSY